MIKIHTTYFHIMQIIAKDDYEKNFISSVVLANETGVRFKDIGALEDVKMTLNELVTLPMRRPELFSRGNLLQVIFFYQSLIHSCNFQETCFYQYYYLRITSHYRYSVILLFQIIHIIFKDYCIVFSSSVKRLFCNKWSLIMIW